MARSPSNTEALIKAHALPVYLRGLTSSDAAVQNGALQALLAIILRAPPPSPNETGAAGSAAGSAADSASGGTGTTSQPPEGSTAAAAMPTTPGGSAGTAKVLESVLETVLGMAFLPASGQSLKLLTTLSLQPHCASRLALPSKFDSVLTIVSMKAFGEPRDMGSAAQALKVIDAILLHATQAISIEQAQRVVGQCDALITLLCDEQTMGGMHVSLGVAEEAALEAARHTGQQAREMHPESFPGSGDHTQRIRRLSGGTGSGAA